jgi:CRISPR-associated protein Cas1
MAGLHALPRVDDGWTFLYVERARVEQEGHAIVLFDEHGRVPVPVASLSALMLGPGTAVTHAAMVALAENGCSAVWVGEAGQRFYAAGNGETHRSANTLAQAEAWALPHLRLQVVQKMYRMRFSEKLDPELSIEQIRGKEGVRVREAYAVNARLTGVPWNGRSYDRGHWDSADPVNRALSAASACLYGLCHGAIVAAGFSPAMGFIHTGKMLAFVYDVADLYKTETTIPAAFDTVAESTEAVEARVRRRCRALFRERRVLERVIPDIQRALGLREDKVVVLEHPEDDARIVRLWDPEQGELGGGRNFGEDAGEEPT